MRYYIGRLSDLENYAKTMNNKKRCLFITNEQLLTQTKMVFKKIQLFLELKEPLSEKYNIRWTTGLLGVGGFSEYLKKGYLVKNYKREDPDIEISPEVLTKGRKAFKRCYEILTQYCSIVDGNKG